MAKLTQTAVSHAAIRGLLGRWMVTLKLLKANLISCIKRRLLHRMGAEELLMQTINIRNISIKCGHCQTYQTLTRFEPGGEWNVYTYECDNDSCDPSVTRTLVEVPRDLDEFAQRDPEWRHGFT